MTSPLARTLRRIRRTLSPLGLYLRGIYRRFREDDVFLWAGAIAFKALVTFIPLLTVITGMGGLILRRELTFARVTAFLESFLPTYQNAQVIEWIRQLAVAASTVTIIGAVGLFLTAVTFFSTTRAVIGNVFKRESRSRPVWRAYLFDARMAVQISFFFLLSLGLTVVVRSVTPAGLELLRALSIDLSGVAVWGQRLIQSLGWTIPLVVTTAMFFQLFYFIPIPKPSWRSAGLGAGVAGVLWELAKLGFAGLAAQLGYAERFRGVSEELELAALLFGLVLALVLWVYYSALVLIVGAEVGAIYEERHRGSPRVPGPEEGPGDGETSSSRADREGASDQSSPSEPGSRSDASAEPSSSKEQLSHS